jgi:dynein light chain roadblock-type
VSDTLKRLSAKPGVVATLAIDRATGSLLKSSGWNGSSPFLTFRASDAETFSSQAASAASAAALSGTNSLPNNAETQSEQGMERLAAMAVNFVNSTGALIQGLDADVSFQSLRKGAKLTVDGIGRC